MSLPKQKVAAQNGWLAALGAQEREKIAIASKKISSRGGNFLNGKAGLTNIPSEWNVWKRPVRRRVLSKAGESEFEAGERTRAKHGEKEEEEELL